MDSEIIKKIIENKVPCYFISPHPDDAVLSAGGLMSHLSKYTSVNVINVFTRPSDAPYSISAKVFLKQCGYESADDLFRDRVSEDKEALRIINVTPINLGFVDALWRRVINPNFLRKMMSRIIPDFGNVYPVYRYHIVGNKVSRNDSELIVSISEKLKSIINTNTPYYIFCPLGIDSHVDHLVVNESCVNCFDNVIMWSDFPYNVRRNKAGGNEEIAKTSFMWNEGRVSKIDMIRLYKSQVGAIFPDMNIDLVPEVYYTN